MIYDDIQELKKLRALQDHLIQNRTLTPEEDLQLNHLRNKWIGTDVVGMLIKYVEELLPK